MVVACLALLVALGGTSVAAVTQLAPRNSVATPSIRNGAVTTPKLRNAAVTTAKVRNNAITSLKVRNRSLRAVDFAAGQLPAGPAGPQGPTGPAGPAGPTGPSNAYAAFLNGPIAVPAAVTTLASVSIPQAGSYVIFAKAYFTIPAASAVVTCRLQAEADFDQSQTYVQANFPFTLALNVVHTFAAAGSATLGCGTTVAGPQANFIKISAIRVGELVNTG